MILAVDIGAHSFQAGLVTARGVLIDRRSAPIETRRRAGVALHGARRRRDRLVAQVPERHHAGSSASASSSGGLVTRGLDLVTPISVPSWRDFPLRQRLEELTGWPCTAISTPRRSRSPRGGSARRRGHPNFLRDHGVGGAIPAPSCSTATSSTASRVTLVRSAMSIVEPGGRRCHCGTQGCLDAEASGAAIDAITGRPASEPSFQIMQRAGEVVGSRRSIDVQRLRSVARRGRRKRRARFRLDVLPRRAGRPRRRARLPYSRGARITPTRLGEQGPLIGAGAVGWRGVRRAARSSG